MRRVSPTPIMSLNTFSRIYGGAPGADKSGPTDIRIILLNRIIALLRRKWYFLCIVLHANPQPLAQDELMHVHIPPYGRVVSWKNSIKSDPLRTVAHLLLR